MTINNLKVTVDGVDITHKVKQSMTPKPKYLLVHESIAASLIKDAGTFAIVGGLIGVGIHFDSVVLQVFGAIMALIVMVGQAASRSTVTECFTIDEARAALDKMESDNA